MKPLNFVGSSLDDLRAFPTAVRHAIGVELMRVQFGGMPTSFKPLKEVGSGPMKFVCNWKAPGGLFT